MREILFRGKRISDGKWLYGSLENHLFRNSADESPVTYIFDPDIEPDYHSFECFDNIDCEVDPKTVGQYVGVVSKNGKRIFEGDVVLVETFRKGVIRCLEKEALFAVDFSSHLSRLCDTTSDYIEIIGNIHDNLELLK